MGVTMKRRSSMLYNLNQLNGEELNKMSFIAYDDISSNIDNTTNNTPVRLIFNANISVPIGRSPEIGAEKYLMPQSYVNMVLKTKSNNERLYERCKHEFVQKLQQIRKADEGQTLFKVCKKCKFVLRID